jgi:hypothetical protein
MRSPRREVGRLINQTVTLRTITPPRHPAQASPLFCCNNSIFDLSFYTWGRAGTSALVSPGWGIESDGHLEKWGKGCKWMGGPPVPDFRSPRDNIHNTVDFTLKSGGSANFQVPPRLLVEGLRVVMTFRYPWERPWTDLMSFTHEAHGEKNSPDIWQV